MELGIAYGPAVCPLGSVAAKALGEARDWQRNHCIIARR